MIKYNFSTGLLFGIIFSIIFISITSINAKQTRGKIGRYQISTAAGQTNTGFPVVFEAVIDTRTGKVISRISKYQDDYK